MSNSQTELSPIDGYRLCLRFVTPDDAAYIHGLRTNPAYNAHLSAVTGTVDDQRQWIKGYKAREAAGSEYYYLIERLDGVPCGVVRLYDIAGERFTWGSWILDHNKPAKAAVESAILSFGAGFERIGLETAFLEARHSNEHAIAFYRRFGIEELRTDDENTYFSYPREKFLSDRAAHIKVVKAGIAT